MQTPYLQKGIPLSPTSAVAFIIEILRTSGRPVKRADIVKHVEQRHEELGGLPAHNPTTTVKKAIGNLAEDRRIQSHGGGFYSLINADSRDADERGGQEVSEPRSVNLEDQIVPEEVLGEGNEIVYVYFNESDRELAVLKKKDYWPCKIGFTASSLQSRLLGQGIMTSMARLPIVGLAILTPVGQRLERAIHFALDEADARIDGAAGTEWFNSSPARIKAWYLSHCKTVQMLRDNFDD